MSKSPKMVVYIDWSEVVREAQSYIESLASGCGYDSDSEHYIVEAVMEAIYGDKVYDWINNMV